MNEQHGEIVVTDEDRRAADESVKRTARLAFAGGLVFLVVATFVAAAVVDLAFDDGLSRLEESGLEVAVAAAFAVFPFWVIMRWIRARAARLRSQDLAVRRVLADEAGRREWEAALRLGLEAADSEVEALDVVSRALADAARGRPAEVLLAGEGDTRLVRLAGGHRPANCPVTTTDGCLAARRGQPLLFPSSERLDVCPKLRGRPGGPCSALCVPVAMMGRTVGVLHVTGDDGDPPGPVVRRALGALADQAGVRVGLLRVMARTRLQAETDGLTGLLNRRSLDAHLQVVDRDAAPFAIVMADLDHFKALNDQYGHPAGDRALRGFADSLRAELRPDDLVCRYGGEEFVVVLPRCSTQEAVDAIERVRERLGGAVARGEFPRLTASFGVACLEDGHDFADAITRADDALLAAKRTGRDRTVLATATDSPGRDVPEASLS